MESGLDPHVVPEAVMIDVAEANIVLVGVKPAHADTAPPGSRVTASCPPSGPSSESVKSELLGASNVNVPFAFPVFVSVSERAEAGAPTAVPGNVNDASGWIASVAPAGVADSW
jgi:hypothetical protein